MAHSGSRVPSAASSSAAVAPPAPNWMPTSGLGFRPACLTFSTRRTQSSTGIVMKPLRNFYDVETQVAALADVVANRAGALTQDVLDEAAGRYPNVVAVAEIDDCFDRTARH